MPKYDEKTVHDRSEPRLKFGLNSGKIANWKKIAILKDMQPKREII